MKKSTVLFAVLALVAAGCTKTRIVDIGAEGGQRSIGFSAYTTRPTKAAQADVTDDNFDSFEVTAIGNNAIYFDDVTFRKDIVWESTPSYFWPAFPLDFYAYNTPEYAATFTRDITTAGQTLFVKPNSDIAKQEDLVAAYEGGKKESDNNSNAAIPINFKHYLTQVVVNAKNSNPTYEVKVCEVKLANLAEDGTYTFNGNAMTATEEKVNSASSTDYTAAFTAKTLGSEPQEVMTEGGAGRWYLIPQSVTAWNRGSDESALGTYDMENTSNGTYLALKVKITANSGDLRIYPATGEEYAWMAVPVPATLAFAQGKKYNVTLDFFSPTGNGAGYVDPETPGDLDGDAGTEDNGKKIIGGVIKFDATVTPWDTVDITISL